MVQLGRSTWVLKTKQRQEGVKMLGVHLAAVPLTSLKTKQHDPPSGPREPRGEGGPVLASISHSG